MIWFTADTHFGHEKIIQHSRRPFTTVDEMDAQLIANWNAVVGPRDDVWHLGDFNFRSKQSTSWYLDQLNGRVHIVWGNHDDKYAKRNIEAFASAQDVKYLKLDGEKITLYHYAQRVWRSSHHGSWHLYGHSHGDLSPLGRSMDVGVDAHGYAPVSFDNVRRFMTGRLETHHHTARRNDD